MFILPLCFKLLCVCGAWRPVSWDNDIVKSNIFYAYKALAMVTVYTLTLSELMGTLLLSKNIEEFSDNSFILSTAVTVCFKFTIITLKRKQIIDLAGMLLEEQTLPRNSIEKELIRKITTYYRYFTKGCVVYLIFAMVTMGALSPMASTLASGNLTLPVKAWQPYKITPLTFSLTYVYQVIGLCFVIGPTNLGHDTLICGFMVLVATQFDLLSLRILELPQECEAKCQENKLPTGVARRIEAQIVAERVRHHVHLIKFTDNLTDIFSATIASNFCMSAFILALGVYRLALYASRGDFLGIISPLFFIAAMFTQLFMFCWFANQVTVKGLEFGQAIGKVDWTDLHEQTVKHLITMMIRSQRPISVSSGSLITLSLESFIAVIKTSYSALNFLLQSSN